MVLILRSQLLFGFVDGSLPCPSAQITNPEAGKANAPPTIVNPQYSVWHHQDQSILSAIICSLTESTIGMVMNLYTSRAVWETLEASFADQSTARAMQIRGALNKEKKLDQSAASFFNKIKSMSDTLASIGQPLRPEEFSAYLLAGLDSEYASLAQLVSARNLSDPMPIRDIYSQLLHTEQRVESRKAELSSEIHAAHYSARPGGSKPPNYQQGYQQQYRPDPRQQGKPGYPSKPTGRNPSPPRRNDRPPAQGSGNRPTCQICEKQGHVASCCFKRFQRNFLGAGNDGRYMDKQIAAFSTTTHGSTSSYPVDPS